MRTYENMFDPLVQELLKQKQLYESLVLENQELHRQLAKLRAGRGLFVQIGDQRFALSEKPVGLDEATHTPLPDRSPKTLSQTEPATEPTTVILPTSGRREGQRTDALERTTPPSRQEEQANLKQELMGSLMLD